MVRAGHQVTVYEQFSEIGGVTATLRREGFGWDLGPLLLEGLGPGEPAGRPAGPAARSAAAVFASTMSRAGPGSPAKMRRITAALSSADFTCRSEASQADKPNVSGVHFSTVTQSPVTTKTIVSPHKQTSSSSLAPHTTRARLRPNCANACASGKKRYKLGARKCRWVHACQRKF